MAVAADLGTTQWQAFNALLDQMLDQPSAERSTWIDALSAEYEALKPALRALRARADGPGAREFLATLPTMPEAARAEADLAAGDRIGPYQLLRELGIGGMGAVWLAERVDGALKRQVALKLPRTSWARGLAERMARERDILATLEHPNIARLYDAGTDARGRPYLALEYVEGQPIDAYCTQRELAVPARVELLLQVARAVAFAHGRLVVHRDLKPTNILVTTDGQARLLDFGIAKLMEGDRAAETQLTQLAGRVLTPDYASPEQIRGEPIGTASDVYSLGVVAFELLAGARPYRLKRGSAAEVEEAVLAADVPLASSVATDPAARRAMRGDLDAILSQALRKDVAKRYPSVEALAEDLGRHLAGQPVSARQDSRGYRLRKFVVRNRVAASAAFAVMVAVAGGTGAALWQAREASRAARLAEERSAVAEREARRAKAVQDFVVDILAQNSNEQQDPQRARNRTARELLDRGAEKIGSALKDDPEARGSILEWLGAMYYQLGLKAQAAALMQQRADVIAAAGGSVTAHVNALLRHLDAVSDGPWTPEHDAALVRVQKVLDATDQPLIEQRAELAMQEAVFYIDMSLPRSLSSATRAVALGRTLPPEQRDFVNGLRFLSRAQLRAGHYRQAEASLREALDQAGQRRSGADAWRVSLLRSLSDIHLVQGRLRAAHDAAAEAERISRRLDGDLHLQTVASSIQAALMQAVAGEPALAANRLDALKVRVRSASPALPDFIGQWIQRYSATIALERGDARGALEHLAPLIAEVRSSHPEPGRLAHLLLSQAVALSMQRSADAVAVASEAMATWDAYSADAGMPGARLPFLVGLARARLAAGDTGSAVSLIDQALAVNKNGAEVDPNALADARTVAALVAVASGEATRAVALAQSALDTAKDAELRRSILGSANGALARGLALSGDTLAACQAIETARSALKFDIPDSRRVSALERGRTACRRGDAAGLSKWARQIGA